MKKNHRMWITSFLFLTIFIKINIFEYLTDMPLELQSITIVSLLYMVFIYYVYQGCASHRRNWYILVNYILVSFFMFIDVIYYRYFNQFTSVVLFNQAKQLGSVKESISLLMDPMAYCLFLDIPIFYYFLKDQERTPSLLEKKKWIKWSVFSISTLIIGIFMVNPFQSDGIKILQNQEFFTYHLHDLYSYIVKGEESQSVTVEDLLKKHERDEYKRGKGYGIGKDRNLIVIQVESLQNAFINRSYEDKEITPNLNKMIQGDTLYFNHYYQQLGKGNTSDAEFVSQNSLYPTIYGQAYSLYENNYFYGLPWILKDKGYKTIAFHGYKGIFWNREKAYPAQGFDTFINEKDYEIHKPIGFGLGDKEFFEQSIPYLKELNQPFYGFFVTLTSHHPYYIPEDEKKLSLKEEHEGTLFGDYLQAINYTDQAIGEFIEKLKENGLYDNSMIVIYGDHYGLSSKDKENKKIMSNYLGCDYDFDDMMNIPLIVHIPGENVNEKIERVGGQIDFMPTMINLMGVKSKNPFVFGQDLLNASSGFVASQTYMLKGSFIDDDLVFEMARDGIYDHSRAWDKNTKKSVDIKESREGYERAVREINLSHYILENDLLMQIVKDEKNYNGIDEKDQDLVPEKYVFYPREEINSQNLDEIYDKGFLFIGLDFLWTDKGDLLVDEMTLDDLVEWMKKNPDAYIVVHTKDKNIDALTKLSRDHPDVLDGFISQIDYMDEYIQVRYLGYKHIIYNLYLSQNTDEEIVDFIKHNRLLAVNMPIERAKTSLSKSIKEIGFFSYVYGVEDIEEMKKLEKDGISGFLIDDININHE